MFELFVHPEQVSLCAALDDLVAEAWLLDEDADEMRLSNIESSRR